MREELEGMRSKWKALRREMVEKKEEIVWCQHPHANGFQELCPRLMISNIFNTLPICFCSPDNVLWVNKFCSHRSPLQPFL